MIEFHNYHLTVLISIIISLIIFYIFNRNQLLLDKVIYSDHKQLLDKNIKFKPILCGGVIIYSCSIFFFRDLFLLNLFAGMLLIVGILSDSNKISSPKLRIFFQIIIVLFFSVFLDVKIDSIGIYFFDIFLRINIISIVFTVFCILILLNGSNFLDGLNTLLLGYYILVCSFLIFISDKNNLIIDENINLLLIFLIIVFLYNFTGKVFLGDSGSYLVSFYLAFFTIDFSLKNDSVSPFLICLFLWYPAFENLFSIIRRISKKKKVHNADQNHLHQLIYKSVSKLKILNIKHLNTSTAIIINFYNFVIFLLFCNYYSNTKILILSILLNSFIYLILYFSLEKKINQSK
tara:strand:+ start:6761 stop:7801 length:1041 start_codon:yes stop_codon:yes gene_type:complete